MTVRFRAAALAAFVFVLGAGAAFAQTPLDDSFKFQGELRFNNIVANSPHDFIFDVFGSAAGGVSLASNNRPNIPVARGVFTVTLNFGPGIFTGDKRWVEIRVRDTLAGGAFTTLSPRVELNATPNALFARSVADGSITSAKILDGAINTVDLANNSVTSGKIQDGGITSADIANGAIGSGKLASDAVSTTKILDGSVTAADIGPNFVSAVDGVANDAGNIDLIAGANVIITPNDATDSITIATTGAATSLDGLGSPQFLRSDVSDTFTGGSLLFTGGSSILVSGGATPTLTIGGANLQLGLGDSSADITTVIGQFVASEISPPFDVLTVDGREVLLGTNATSTIRFFESGTSTFAHRIAWEDGIVDATANLSGCVPTGPVSSALIFDVGDGTASGWAFTNGADSEVLIDEVGTIAADFTVNASAGCDLAEAFLGPDGLEPGTLVTADPRTPEGVVPTKVAYDPAMVGVVSTLPAFRMSGGTTDVLPFAMELLETQELLRLNPNDLELLARFHELERTVDSWPRGNVDVALVGRVPVKVVGPVRVGEPLTSSHVPGHAMALAHAGPSIGIALEPSDGQRSTVLVLLQPGHRLPLATDSVREAPLATDDAIGVASVTAVSEILDRLGRLETHVGVAGAPGDTSASPIPSAGAAGTDGADGADAVLGRSFADRLVREAWGDFDGDGLDDVLVLLPAAPARLYRNQGDGSFADVTRGSGLEGAVGARIGRWADYDGDTKLDLLLVDRAGRAALHQGAGTGAFTDVTPSLGLDFGQPIVVAEWIDYDVDRRPDLRVELGDGSLALFHNRGHGAFERIELRAAGTPAADGDAHVRALEAEVRTLKALVESLVAKPAEANR